MSRESCVDSPAGNPQNILATNWFATLSVHVRNHVMENAGSNLLELLFHHLNLLILQIVAQLLVEQPGLWSRALGGIGSKSMGVVSNQYILVFLSMGETWQNKNMRTSD